MGSMLGERVRVSIFGQSHGEAIGVVIDGLPSGEAVDLDVLAAFMARRAPGRGDYATGRQEADRVRVLSGLAQGKTCGAPFCAVIENTDARSGAYKDVHDLPRPGHADFPAVMRDGAAADLRGGGHFSGRLTAPLCIAGGVALQLLGRRGITVGAHILSIGGVAEAAFDPVAVTADALRGMGAKAFPVLDDGQGAAMRAAMEAARQAKDSVGGVVECAAVGLPAGLGAPMFGGVESRLSAALFGIPAVRGVSFGAGFDAAALRGSAHNDAYCVADGRVMTETNRHGGVLGGLTTGMSLCVRAAFKPTPSIGLPQRTVRLSTMAQEEICVEGRHDACVVPRAVPCVEAAVAVVLLDLMCEGANF